MSRMQLLPAGGLPRRPAQAARCTGACAIAPIPVCDLPRHTITQSPPPPRAPCRACCWDAGCHDCPGGAVQPATRGVCRVPGHPAGACDVHKRHAQPGICAGSMAAPGPAWPGAGLDRVGLTPALLGPRVRVRCKQQAQQHWLFRHAYGSAPEPRAGTIAMRLAAAAVPVAAAVPLTSVPELLPAGAAGTCLACAWQLWWDCVAAARAATSHHT